MPDRPAWMAGSVIALNADEAAVEASEVARSVT